MFFIGSLRHYTDMHVLTIESIMHAKTWQDVETAGVLQQLASLTKKVP